MNYFDNRDSITSNDKNQLGLTATLMINIDHINKIIPILLSQQVPFTLIHDRIQQQLHVPTSTGNNNSIYSKQQIHIPTSIGNDNSTHYIEKTHLDKDFIVIEAIYQKYIKSIDKYTPPNINEIANEINMSVSKFKLLFNKHYGASFFKLYMNRKMEYAGELLREGFRATEVSKKLGYGGNSSIKFNKMFQKHFGVTPKKYQMMQYEPNKI